MRLHQAVEEFADERAVSFSEALRQLLEVGIVAAHAARELPPEVEAYRFIAVPADDASPDDPGLFDGP